MGLEKECSLPDTSELRKLILDNPDLPLIIFCNEDLCTGDYGYTQGYASSGSIDRLTLYAERWMDEDDYREQLIDDLNCEEEYENLSDEEFYKIVDEKVKETEFITAIVIYVG